MNIGDLIKVTMFSKFGLPTLDGPKIGIVIGCFEVPANMYDQTHDLTWISEGKVSNICLCIGDKIEVVE